MAEGEVAIGLMSGTSLDGIDVALVETDGERLLRLGPAVTYPYAHADRETIRAAFAAAWGIADRTLRPPVLAAAEAVVTRTHAAAVERFLGETAIDRRTVGVVGFHGQTVLHEPATDGSGVTIQLGDGQALADRLGLPVAFDMRAADVRAGGQGAPLAPAFHQALARLLELPGPLAFLNIGGVANVTLVPDPQAPLGNGLLAFDTGPGNALMDDWAMRHGIGAFDADGRLARSGTVAEAALDRYLADPWFALPPPKSLDRDHFGFAPVEGLSVADGAATLLAFSARSIAVALAALSPAPGQVIVTGGGAHNGALREGLAALIGRPVRDGRDVGFDGDAIEAQAFALLAVRARRGLPLSFPGTTGAPRPLSGGIIATPARPDGAGPS